ncbi:MAG: hypothetical protein AAGI90_02240 [Chlamydiota bacterium]
MVKKIFSTCLEGASLITPEARKKTCAYVRTLIETSKFAAITSLAFAVLTVAWGILALFASFAALVVSYNCIDLIRQMETTVMDEIDASNDLSPKKKKKLLSVINSVGNHSFLGTTPWGSHKLKHSKSCLVLKNTRK